MNKTLIGLCVGGVVAGAFAVNFMIGVSAHNYGNTMDKKIVAAYNGNRNSLSNTTLKVKEMFSVRDIYYNDLKEIINNNMQGRYGSGGSKAVFQFLKENNLAPDTSMDKQVMNVLNAGRNEFKQSQDALLDLKRSYTTELDSYFYGGYIRAKGFPKINLSDYSIIIDTSVDDKFKSKKDSKINLR